VRHDMPAGEETPRRFSILVGRGADQSWSVKADGAEVVYEVLDSGGVAVGPDIVEPSQDSWKVFWNIMDEIGAWDWDQQYEGIGVLDGSGFDIAIVAKGHRIFAMGISAYPPNSTKTPSPEFERLMRGVSALVGGREFGPSHDKG